MKRSSEIHQIDPLLGPDWCQPTWILVS